MRFQPSRYRRTIGQLPEYRDVLPHSQRHWAALVSGALCCGALLLAGHRTGLAAEFPAPSSSTWPQPYTVTRDDALGTLTLRTPYYVVDQDLKRGGTITRISLQHGKVANLLAGPVETRVRDEGGNVFSDVRHATPRVSHRREGLNEIVTVESELADERGASAGVQVLTTLTYRWGHIKIRKELRIPGGMRVKELSPFAAVFDASLSDYGYREGVTEEDGAPPFSFGSNRWGKLRSDQPADPPLKTPHVPRSLLLADAGVEGIEWFCGSDLSQWDLQCTGRRGQGQCRLEPSADPRGLALVISPVWNDDAAKDLPATCVFDYYLAVPLLEGHAQRPWLHTSFNRNRGNWVAPDEIRRWAEKGIQTVHCHNDGDYYGDGLFWRDGSYPPYPDMDRFDQVLQECHRSGIRTATYFSNKELHPSTPEYEEHGQQWGRKNRQGNLQHNFFRPNSEFGAQMCLRSGWLDYLKLSIDRVLKNHPLDGVYYDWNVALLCCNPLHEANRGDAAQASGHWDIDELLDLMEWTRNRVGPAGLVIVHNTTTPMYATENYADHVVATEWGYRQWKDQAPNLADLPLEWTLAGARSRGVISYGVLDGQSPIRLHRLFAAEALLGGVTPWPASEQALELLQLLKPLGDLRSYRFADWRNSAVTLSDGRCGSAVYSRSDVSYLVLANLDPDPKQVVCTLRPPSLPYPLNGITTAQRLVTDASADEGAKNSRGISLDASALAGAGATIELAGDELAVICVR
jgi:hypothetical protein